LDPVYRRTERCDGRTMRKILLGAIAALLLAAAPASAARPAVAKNDAKVYGHTISEWTEVFYQHFFTLPADQVPFVGGSADPCLQVGHLLIYGGAPVGECTVRPGTAVLIGIFGGECSNVEPDPFFGETAADRLACARAFIDAVTALTMTVDGREIPDLFSYRAATADMTLDMAEGNILGVPAGPIQSVGDGYQLILRPLTPGTHHIFASGTAGSGESALTLTTDLTLHVVP
jgi:hypothetical protein